MPSASDIAPRELTTIGEQERTLSPSTLKTNAAIYGFLIWNTSTPTASQSK